MEDSNLTPELALQRIDTICVVEHGCPVIGFGLIGVREWQFVVRQLQARWYRENVYSSLELNSFKGIFSL